MIINIVGGNGRMGRTHKPIFEAAGHKVIVSDLNESTCFTENAHESDLSIVSVPISQTQKVIRKIGAYCDAICDFTSVKVKPLEAMLQYCDEEVFGLHPLYGPVDSINGKTVVYCPTRRSRDKSREILNVFKNAGANIIEMNSRDHDYMMSKLQIVRMFMLQSFGSFLAGGTTPINQIYDISPPPTKIILDLMARQADQGNDQLYQDMLKYNPFAKRAIKELMQVMRGTGLESEAGKIREFFGSMLAKRQDKAKYLISNV